jgi:hypothetical protein
MKAAGMRYPMPNFPCEFELSDDWLREAGITDFRPRTEAYLSTDDAVLVSLREIQPPYRLRSRPEDGAGFDRIRMIQLLKGFVAEANIPPVPLLQLPAGDHVAQVPYQYIVRDGFHRFYASVAARFTCLPSSIDTLTDAFELSRNLGYRS